jgi:16S rRNA (cytosine967-C5)-methyltransferase
MIHGAPLATELARAARVVARIAQGKSLAEELERFAARDAAGPRAALIDLTHGTLRRYGRVQAIVRELSQRGTADVLLEALLWCSLYALESERYGDHTVVDQAVKACAALERWPSKGYVNAVLRRFVRERTALASRLARDEVAKYQHPQWWIDMLRGAYPDAWQRILDAGNSHPPMCLRVNLRRADTDEYCAQLAARGIVASRVGTVALLLERPVPVERLPCFAAGLVSVQDLGAQRAAYELDLRPGQRVLDACAAPGGKAAHILERADVALTALDIDEARATRMSGNLERLGLRAAVRIGDAAEPRTWWDHQPYERILADVPCSASGVVRRHPDLKWLRRAGDVGRFAERQHSMLAALWPLLAPGGKLLYVTCSVFAQENGELVERFIAGRPGARRIALADRSPAQWLPDSEHDGFFYALIEKQL